MADLPNFPAMPTRAIVDAVEYVAEGGPTIGRPLVGEINLDPDYRQFVPVFGRHLKEIRPLGTDIRILCTFTPDRTLVLLYAGDKSGDWNRWYGTRSRRPPRCTRPTSGSCAGRACTERAGKEQ